MYEVTESALLISSGQELERFSLGTVVISRTTYTVLTGYEGTGLCFWCGGELKGKLKRYCYGHMQEYYRHFDWTSASSWCADRYDHKCANCGTAEVDIPMVGRLYLRSGLEIHHIIPLKGESRQFTAYNLPWNLIALCHGCHLEVHAAMRPLKSLPDPFAEALAKGQTIFAALREIKIGVV